MKQILLVVAYDGTRYCGWQMQPNGITVEEVLNKALRDFLKEEVYVVGASRTDSGVHARGNVCVFRSETRIAADKIAFALNNWLPDDIRIRGSLEVPYDFHPRHGRIHKTYEYRIFNHTFPDPTCRLNSHFMYLPLDVKAMREAAAYLVGRHDFKSFCSIKNTLENTVREILSLTIEQEGAMITFRVKGNGFLYNMVRIIVGTLIKVGLHVYPPEYVKEILEAKDRALAGPTARACGLTLAGIEYLDEEFCQRVADPTAFR